jgi:predicted small metal-binding protein
VIVPGWHGAHRAETRGSCVTYTQTCPRCGQDFAGTDKEAVADTVVEHARASHHHALDRDIALAHLEGVHPHDRESE